MPEHEKIAYEIANKGKKKKTVDDGSFFSKLKRALPINVDTDNLEDYTIEFKLAERTLRLRFVPPPIKSFAVHVLFICFFSFCQR